jgi:hypothetical protein
MARREKQISPQRLANEQSQAKDSKYTKDYLAESREAKRYMIIIEFSKLSKFKK